MAIAETLPNTEVDIPVVRVIRARDFEVKCPKCGHVAEGWARDPRGLTDTCDECGTKYRIPGDALVTFR